jgi:protein phosphatase
MKLFRRRRRDYGPRIDVGCATATGARPDNQDRCEITPRWAIVSDGAGGNAGGALAAELTVREVASHLNASASVFDRNVLTQAVVGANNAVRSRRASDAAVAAMTATLTMAAATAVAADESSWLVVNVGDSPAWVAGSHGFTRVTEEHNLAAELARSGGISPDMARTHPGRHLITRSIGAEDSVTADLVRVTLHPGDQLVLASDGIEVLNEPDMHDAVRDASSAADVARRLVDEALANGASDNVTVAVLRHPRE